LASIKSTVSPVMGLRRKVRVRCLCCRSREDQAEFRPAFLVDTQRMMLSPHLALSQFSDCEGPVV
jgi:hypothetical protein